MASTLTGWDAPSTSKLPPRIPAKPVAVVDDWEDSDNESEPDARPSAERNQKIWKEANLKPAAPMPEVITPAASNSGISIQPGMFEKKIQILKRPTNSRQTMASQPTSPPETLKDKEARYQAARERIFGAGLVKEGTSPSKEHASVIVRHPKGPPETGIATNPQANGFAGRSRVPT